MERETIDLKKLNADPVSLWGSQWLLLCAGDFAGGDYNAMTVAWGSLGVMWHKPYAQVVVRPGRYTYEFMEKYNEWTLSVLPESCRSALNLMGSKSGRDMDKIHDAGLTPCASPTVSAPAFAEAELLLECRTMYRDRMNPALFLDKEIDMMYPKKDYHIIYYGEILNAEGTGRYRS